MNSLAQRISGGEVRDKRIYILFTDITLNLLGKVPKNLWPIVHRISLCEITTIHCECLFSIEVDKLRSKLFCVQLHVLAETLHYHDPKVVWAKLKGIVEAVAHLYGE